MSAPSAPRPQTVGKSLFQFRNRAREKKTAAKPPAERSEANKVPSEARLINYISTYTCNTIEKTAAKPPAERSEANKVPFEPNFSWERNNINFFIQCHYMRVIYL